MRACLLVVAAILGAADPFDLSERAHGSVRSSADGTVGVRRTAGDAAGPIDSAQAARAGVRSNFQSR